MNETQCWIASCYIRTQTFNSLLTNDSLHVGGTKKLFYLTPSNSEPVGNSAACNANTGDKYLNIPKYEK